MTKTSKDSHITHTTQMPRVTMCLATVGVSNHNHDVCLSVCLWGERVTHSGLQVWLRHFPECIPRDLGVIFLY